MEMYVVMEIDGFGETSMVIAFHSLEVAEEFAKEYRHGCWIESVKLYPDNPSR